MDKSVSSQNVRIYLVGCNQINHTHSQLDRQMLGAVHHWMPKILDASDLKQSYVDFAPTQSAFVRFAAAQWKRLAGFHGCLRIDWGRQSTGPAKYLSYPGVVAWCSLRIINDLSFVWLTIDKKSSFDILFHPEDEEESGKIFVVTAPWDLALR